MMQKQMSSLDQIYYNFFVAGVVSHFLFWSAYFKFCRVGMIKYSLKEGKKKKKKTLIWFVFPQKNNPKTAVSCDYQLLRVVVC